jgi:hypothetical protein
MFWVPLIVLALPLVAAAVIGAYYIGRDSGPSPHAIAARISKAVAVQRATDVAASTRSTSGVLARQHDQLVTQFSHDKHQAVQSAQQLAYARGRVQAGPAAFAAGRKAALAASRHRTHRALLQARRQARRHALRQGRRQGRHRGLRLGRHQGKRHGFQRGYRRGLRQGSVIGARPR